MLSESSPNGGRDYVYLGDVLVSVVDTPPPSKTQGATPPSTINYVITDHQGTPRAVTDSSGNTIWKLPIQGNAFEEQPPVSNGYTLNIRSQGEYYDAETGLNYNGQRYRDPNAGRFLQPDPIGLEGGIDPYVAVRNNPLRYTDRRGLQEADKDEEDVEALRNSLGPRPLGPNQAAFEDMEGNPFRQNPNETLEHFARRRAYQFARQCETPARLAKDRATGGVYGLFNPDDELMYIGRTNDFARRRGEHANDPLKRGYDFQRISPTDDYATQRGLEQTYLNMYAPPLNQVNGIAPSNPNYNTYMDAAQNYLNSGGHQ